MPTSGNSIINFSGLSPRNWHTLRKSLLFFSGTVIANFSLDFPFNLVLSNIDMLHLFMFACYHHTTE